MKTNTYNRLLNVGLAALVGVLLTALAFAFTASAAPEPRPIVAANAPAPLANDQYPNMIVLNSAAITQDTNTTGVLWLKGSDPFDNADIFTVIDQGTTNTITVKLQYSPDNSNWFDYATLVSANTADASSSYTVTVAGMYVRANLDVGNSNTVTPTVKMVLR